MLIFRILRSHARSLSTVGFCFLGVLPAQSAQTGKELIVDACYNARQQFRDATLWSSRVERHTGGHIYVEKEIETVDGPIRRLISIDGHQPSSSERKQDDDRLRKLQNPSAQLAMKKDREATQKKLDDVLRVMPEALIFEDRGRLGELEKLAFHPNPSYRPTTYEEMVLHAMSGIVLIDLQEKRLAQLSATLTDEVDFGHGLIGQLRKGGTIEIKRIRLSPGIWKTSSSKFDIDGRIVFFKIVRQQDENQSEFRPLPSDTNVNQALHMIDSK